MINRLDLKTVTILQEYSNGLYKIIGKYVGGKRYKRQNIFLSTAELREIKLSNLLKNENTKDNLR